MNTTLLKTPGVASYCSGLPPLTARLESWMKTTLNNERLHGWAADYGSPLNLLSTVPFARNVANLRGVAAKFGIENFEIFFARKANKCLAFVHEMKALEGGIDVASLEELEQALDAGVPPEMIICTAAIKNERLIAMCVGNRVTIAVDNHDEYHLIFNQSTSASIALRVSGFEHRGSKLESRFGFDVDDAGEFARTHRGMDISGLHFHLDGYDADQRVDAIRQSLVLVKEMRAAGHSVKFIDMGGGFPVCYLRSAEQWAEFHRYHQQSLRGIEAPITYRNHPLGLQVHNGEVHGEINSYPFFQFQTAETWLSEILNQVHRELQDAGIELRCEPGRALLDGAGMTVARVEFVKKRKARDSEHFIGLSMNRTQCRTSSDDFLVDPIVVKRNRPDSEPLEGYLVGSYCTESELLCLRKLRFPAGIERGDLVVFPNTAGYFMHFLESRSHQFPLANNYIVDEHQLDDIDT